MDFSIFLVGWAFEFFGIYFLVTQSINFSSWILKNWSRLNDVETEKEVKRLKKSTSIWTVIGFSLLGVGLMIQFLYVFDYGNVLRNLS